MIADQFNNRVIETNPRGEIIWQYGLGPGILPGGIPAMLPIGSIYGTRSAERWDGLTLIAAAGIPADTVVDVLDPIFDSRVIVVNETKQILWQYGQFGIEGAGTNELMQPNYASWVPSELSARVARYRSHRHAHQAMFSGTILITDQGNHRVIEVNEANQIIWQYGTTGIAGNGTNQLNEPSSALRLANGNTLIADTLNDRVIEINPNSQIVKVFTAETSLANPNFASRLANGNTVIADSGNDRIVEIDSDDIIVWLRILDATFGSVASSLPSTGIRLRDGDTIISDQYNDRVITVNRTGVTTDYYGLPLVGAGPDPDIGANSGYHHRTTQLGLFAPHDAKIIGDYTGQLDLSTAHVYSDSSSSTCSSSD